MSYKSIDRHFRWPVLSALKVVTLVNSNTHKAYLNLFDSEAGEGLLKKQIA